MSRSPAAGSIPPPPSPCRRCRPKAGSRCRSAAIFRASSPAAFAPAARFAPLGPAGLPNYSIAQADAPVFGEWRGLGAQQLVTGFVRPGRRRPDHGRLLPLRCRRRARAGAAGLSGHHRQLAPRGQQMRRCHLFAADRRRRLSRYPRGVRRRDRPQEQSPEAHRDHGFGRREPALSDRGRGDRGHPALLARRQPAGLHQLSGPPRRGCGCWISPPGRSACWSPAWR